MNLIIVPTANILFEPILLNLGAMPVPLAIFKVSFEDILMIYKLSFAMRLIIKDFPLVYASISVNDDASDL
jgi:hypothetical protein